MSGELDPYKTILVIKHGEQVVGRIPATSPNAETLMEDLASHYGSITVDYEPDPTGGLLGVLHQRR
jgi:hypothetical protein